MGGHIAGPQQGLSLRRDRGVYVNPTLPPATPEGEALLRTSYMATHTEALLDEAMDIIGEVMARE